MDPVLSDNAVAVLKKRYLIKNENGEVVETPKQMFERVARHVANGDLQYGEDAEKSYQTFYDMMARRDFMPNTPCLANAGKPRGTGMLSACFVLEIDDSMESIFGTLADAAMITKSGGGWGASFSRLRPEGDIVRSSGGVSSGPISFMKIFDAATEHVKQGGMRRGATSAVLRTDHPDILKFIDAKRDHKALNNFNISVAITDAFMDALFNGRSYDLINPHTHKVVGQLSAQQVWNRIVDNAWYSGEPGLFFVDRVNKFDALSDTIPIEAANPCFEQALPPNGSCNLGSVNLSNFVDNSRIDFPRLANVITSAVHFLDNVIEVNQFPIDKISTTDKATRRIGVGPMGWADLLIKVGIRYDTAEAVQLAREIMQFFNNTAVRASEELAKRRKPFPLWDKSKWALRGDAPRRNAAVTTAAPTGTTSIFAGCSSGIEPLFAVAMLRRQADMEMADVNPLFVVAAKREGWYSDDLMQQVAERGTAKIDGVPQKWQELFTTAAEISPEWHVRMQAAFQDHIESGVSKTVNLPNSATVEDVDHAFRLAYELGCKGITVYRDGSRSGQVLSAGTTKPTEVAPMKVEVVEVRPSENGHPVERRSTDRRTHGLQRRTGETISRKTGFGTVHVTINKHPSDGEPFECFIELGKSGAETKAITEATGRALSYLLSIPSSVTPRERLSAIADQFIDIGGGSQTGFGKNKTVSIPDGVAQAIREYLGEIPPGDDEDEAHEDSTPPAVPSNGQSAKSNGNGHNGHNGKNGNGHKHQSFDICPECQTAALLRGKCDSCLKCGYSRCS